MPKFIDFSSVPEFVETPEIGTRPARGAPRVFENRDPNYQAATINNSARTFFGFFKPLQERLAIVANNLNNNDPNEEDNGNTNSGGTNGGTRI